MPSPFIDFHDLFEGSPLRATDEETGELFDMRTRKVGIGTLTVPTGIIVLGDPLSHLQADEALVRRVPPGRYPVELLVRDDERGRIDSVLLARLLVRPGRPARWEAALNRYQVEGGAGPRAGYPSDAATSCFVDQSIIAEYLPPSKVTTTVRGGIVYHDHQSDGRAERNTGELLRAFESHRRTHGGLGHVEWRCPRGNLIAFTTGSDRVVPSFWGLDARDEAVVLVSAIDMDEDIHPELRWPDVPLMRIALSR